MAYFFQDDKDRVEVRTLTGQVTVPANATAQNFDISESAMELVPVENITILGCAASVMQGGGYPDAWEYRGQTYVRRCFAYGWSNPNDTHKNTFRLELTNSTSDAKVYEYKITYMISNGN